MKISAAVLFGSLALRLAAHQLPGAPADLPLRDLNGTKRSIADYRGKIVVVNFWATWCEPCRDEMPWFVSAANLFPDVIVIAASADDETTQPQIPAFIRKMKITFPIWTGASTTTMEQLGLGSGLPATAFMDRNGAIAFRILGPVTKAELQDRIEYLLGNRQSTAPEPLVNKMTVAANAAKGDRHENAGEENHHHGSVSMEGASTVPS